MLYLGVSTGTTISHISDIVGPNGTIFGVEHSSRVARDFLDRVASYRKNIVPIIQDARKPEEFFSVYKKVDIVSLIKEIYNPEEINNVEIEKYNSKETFTGKVGLNFQYKKVSKP